MYSIKTESDLFERGYQDVSIGFTYLPSFNDEASNKAYWAGWSLAQDHRKRVKDGLAKWTDHDITMEFYQAMVQYNPYVFGYEDLYAKYYSFIRDTCISSPDYHRAFQLVQLNQELKNDLDTLPIEQIDGFITELEALCQMVLDGKMVARV